MNQDLAESGNQGSHYEKYEQISITHAKEAITYNNQIGTFFCWQR